MKENKENKEKRRYFTIPLALTENQKKHSMALVLGYIRLCKNRDGTANPSHDNIAKNVGISEKSVRRHLNQAKKEGWIDWLSGQGSHESNSYSFPASSDWLNEEEYLINQTVSFIGQKESVKLESLSVKSDSLIGQNDTLHRSQLRPTNISNIVNIFKREDEPSPESLISKKETGKRKKDTMTDITAKEVTPQYDLLTYFSDLFLQTYKEHYIPSTGRDLTLISGLLKYFSPEQLKEKMVQAFIQLKPKDGKVTLPYFKACINNLSDSKPQIDKSNKPVPNSTGKLYQISKEKDEQDQDKWFFTVLSTGDKVNLQQVKSPFSEDGKIGDTNFYLDYLRKEGKFHTETVNQLEKYLKRIEYALSKIQFQTDKGLYQISDTQREFWQGLKVDTEKAIESMKQ